MDGTACAACFLRDACVFGSSLDQFGYVHVWHVVSEVCLCVLFVLFLTIHGSGICMMVVQTKQSEWLASYHVAQVVQMRISNSTRMLCMAGVDCGMAVGFSM